MTRHHRPDQYVLPDAFDDLDEPMPFLSDNPAMIQAWCCLVRVNRRAGLSYPPPPFYAWGQWNSQLDLTPHLTDLAPLGDDADNQSSILDLFLDDEDAT